MSQLLSDGRLWKVFAINMGWKEYMQYSCLLLSSYTRLANEVGSLIIFWRLAFVGAVIKLVKIAYSDTVELGSLGEGKG